MKLLGGAALVAAAIACASSPAAAGAPCAGEDSCRTACDDGNALACRALGDMLATGDGVDPDHGAAAEAWGKGCAKDARSCYQLSLLQRTGWMLEVPRDLFASDEKLATALDLAIPSCDGGSGDGCFTAALALRERLERDGWPKDQKDRAGDVVARGKKACEKGVTDACIFLRRDLWALANNELLDSKAFNDVLDLGNKELVSQCKSGNGDACYESAGAIYDDKLAKSVSQAIDKVCEDGKPRACLAKALVLVSQIKKPEADDPVVTVAIALLIDACGQTATELCAEFGQGMIEDKDLEKLGAHDPAKAIKILRFQCSHGIREACYAAGRYLKSTKGKDAAALLDRSCQLTDPDRPCDACVGSPELGECKARETWGVSVQCSSGNLEMCEALGDRYRAGEGVAASGADAAQSYKFACDASIKSACGKLDDVCHADRSIGNEVCAPSLLHTDVFYEAEWQMRVNQSATLSTGAGTVGGIPTVTVAGAAGVAGGGVTVQRGKLDADLVVSVVLDRARQAAVKLVVEELQSKMGRRGLRTYMRDLLEQGAELLADTTSLRRDALQDLGMTLVRAFAASNLVRTVLGDPDAVKAAPTIGAIVKRWKKPGWLADAAGHVAPDLEAYLADLAYWALGAEPLFQRAGAADDPAPACPFKDDRKALCEAVTTRAQVTVSLRIDGVLTALNMVRALGTAGGIDVRRLIEAIVQSTSIVDFASTPGLNINTWQSRIVDDLRTRFGTLRDRLSDLQRLVNPKTYDDDGPDLATLARQARLVKAWLRGDDARSLVGDDVATDLAGVLVMEKFAASQLAPAPDQLTATRADCKAALDRLGSSWRSKLGKKVSPVYDRIDKVSASIDDLGRHIEAIRVALGHHQKMGADHAHLAIDDVPLGDLDELLAIFPKVVEVLDALDTGVRDVLPAIDLRGVRFARSSVVRLLGFLDLMSRVARSVRLTQTVRQVIDTLALLGRWKDGEFSAPLFDMLQPVLDVIETRNPMPLEQLFAIVGRVRLDSLVTSLIQDDPCANEDRAECWVFKIAYSLQEAITRDGDSIRIDGAEVAKRLARFGDDFRRREKSRWYFHLTVGVSSLFSTPPTMEEMRFTPVIAEQVGFGWASEAFWGDRLTFKVGLSASGILYRMLLDNAESNAVMGNFFVAVDVYDLVEAYAAATVLAYPPDDMQKAQVRPGASFGLSVPLSAYLEKL